MFERFTDRARRVLVVSESEARDLGHSFIRPEHLFLGLLQGQGVAAKVLAQHGVELEVARRRFADSIASSEEAKEVAKVPFSPAAKKTLELSLREALRLGHNYIGTEHILLGLVEQSRQDASLWLTEVTGVDQSTLSSSVEEVLKGAGSENRRSPALNAATARARGIAGKGLLTTGHLLSSIVEDARSMASKALRELGVTKESLDAALARIDVDDTTDAAPRPRKVEIRIGDSTVVVDDPEVAGAIGDLTPQEVADALKKALGEKTSGGKSRRRSPRRSN